MVGLPALIYGILLPALVAGILLLLGGRGTDLERREKPLLGALALGGGYLVAHVGLLGMPPVPFGAATVPWVDWIAWLVAGTIVLAPVRLVPAWNRWSGAVVIGLLSVGLERLLLKGQIESTPIRFLVVLALYVSWSAIDRLSQRSSGLALPLAWVVAGTAIALCALFASSASLAQQAGAVVSGCGAACVVARLDKGFRLPVGAVAVGYVVFAGVLAIAWIYELPLASVALCALALVTPWITEAPFLARRGPTLRALAAALAAAVPGAIAVWLAYQANVAKSGPYEY